MRPFVALLALSPALALAAPTELVWQGRLLDASGAPLQGARDLGFTLSDGVGGGRSWTFADVAVEDGFASVVLDGLDPAWFTGAATLDITVDGAVLVDDAPLHSAPHAQVAAAQWGETSRGGAGWRTGSHAIEAQVVEDGVTHTPAFVTATGLSTADLMVATNALIGAGPGTHAIEVVADDASEAVLSARGSSEQGTGRLYVGQSLSHGGGMIYDGDASPDVVGNADWITLYRRTNGEDFPVLGYAHNSDTVAFTGGITTGASSSLGGTTTLGRTVVNDDLTVSSDLIELSKTGSSNVIRVVADDNSIASFEAIGTGQGTGRVYVGQSQTHGGGFYYNGDDAPNLLQGSDDIVFFRRSASVDHMVFWYDYDSSTVAFASPIVNGSDARLKRDVQPVQGALDAVSRLRGVSYEWIDGRSPGRQLGLIAQEVQEVLPELVVEDGQGMLAVQYDGLIPVLLEAVKELRADNEALRRDLDALRDGVAGPE